MQRGSFSGICAGLALVFGASMFAEGQEAPGGRGGAQPIPQFNRTPPVDAAAHERGRSLWASHCVDCHGAQARGTEKGPNIIRTKTVNYDRSSPQAGSVLGPFLKAGHPTQSGKPASFTNDEVIALATFLRQRVTDTMRWSTLFVPGDILVGDSRAGGAYLQRRRRVQRMPQRDDAQSAGDRVAVGHSRRSAAANALSSPRARRTKRRGLRRQYVESHDRDDHTALRSCRVRRARGGE